MLIYDEDTFQKFRELAVTDVNDLVIGKTYYMNTYPETFVLKELITYAESDKRDGFSKISENDELGFFITEDDMKFSLRDKNICASYNPWLIFEDEETAKKCREELDISEESDIGFYPDSYDYYDDYYDAHYEDERYEYND